MKEWSDVEKKTLFDLKNKTTLTYAIIGQKLHRSPGAVTRMYQKTNWKKFFRTVTDITDSTISKQIHLQS